MPAFQAVHASSAQITSIRINPGKISGFPEVTPDRFLGYGLPLDTVQQIEPVPWTVDGYYLAARPSFTMDPLFHAGSYYVQEASSMFLEQCFGQLLDLSKPLKILDLCAAPGGKSTHIQAMISPESLLVSNDVIKSRAAVLKENIVKWGSSNVVVTNNDPKDFSRLPGYFDVVLIDAPCSGSGLFRRDENAIQEWSPGNVTLCSQRQERIVADAWPALKEGGLLIYSTCSYSKEEDEDLLDWVVNEFHPEPLNLILDKDWNIVPVQTDQGAFGYRFWPDKVKGEGFFLSCFRKHDGEKFQLGRTKNKPVLASKKESSIIQPWIGGTDWQFIIKNKLIYAVPECLLEDLNFLLTTLRVLYSGIIVGELYHDSIGPAHALAMSTVVPGTMPAIELNYESAILYLQRRDLSLDFAPKGWSLVRYQAHNLGWVKVLQNRINNYYPKESRILKDL